MTNTTTTTTTTTGRRRTAATTTAAFVPSSISSLRRRGFWALGVVGSFVIILNLAFFSFLTQRQRQARPMIHGVVYSSLNIKNNPPVLSKQGSLALQGKPVAVGGGETAATAENDGKEQVVQILAQATIQVTAEMRQRLPTWEQVTRIVGHQPVVQYSTPDACDEFRENVPAVERMLGAAGMFSTGTNLVTTLLKNNCQIPERVAYYGINATREDHGMRWQVPWGKHTPAHYKYAHAAKLAKNIDKNAILPVITIRNPYLWLKSMCKNAYAARWNHSRNHCPNLQQPDKNDWNTVTVKYGAGSESYTSLAHLFNDWYHGYTQNATYPWVMIRMEGMYILCIPKADLARRQCVMIGSSFFFVLFLSPRHVHILHCWYVKSDLVFYTKETITQVCECAGGRIRTDRPFVYTVDSAKADSPGHDTTVGLLEAWIRYSQPPAVRGGFSLQDYQSAKSVLDPELMQLFGYVHPPEQEGG